MASPSRQRITVHLKSESTVKKANFSQCLVDYFHFSSGSGPVGCYLHKNRLILHEVPEDFRESSSNNLNTFHKPDGSAKEFPMLKHPIFCPFSNMTSDEIKSLPEEVQERGIEVGVNMIVATRDNHILLTQRAHHMRTFAYAWVPPGGHIEYGETLLKAGLRELHEETGLTFNSKTYNEKIMCMWESTYPPFLSLASPLRHHVVIYLQLNINQTWEQLDKHIKLDPTEVQSSTWVSADMAKLLVDEIYDGLPTINPPMTILLPNGQQEKRNFDPKLYFRGKPSLIPISRITTGTRYAMSEWLKTIDGKYQSKHCSL